MKKIAKIIKESFDSETVHRDLYEFLWKNMDQKTLEDAMVWLETPIAKKITREENKSQTVESQAETLRYIAGFQKNPPPPDRVAVIQKLVKEAKVVEGTVELVLDTMAGLMSSVNVVLPDVKKVSREEIRIKMNDMKPMLEQSMRRQITLGSFYTYRNISNQDLEKYIDFLSSESGAKFQDIGNKAISYTLIRFFDSMTEELVSTFKS